MKMISWNVNGIRACIKKGFMDYFNEVDWDIFCMQEIKAQEGQVEIPSNDYYEYFNYAKRAGYSGTSVFTKVKPLNVSYGLGFEEHDNEGRVITLEYDNFHLVNCYTPNSLPLLCLVVQSYL